MRIAWLTRNAAILVPDEPVDGAWADAEHFCSFPDRQQGRFPSQDQQRIYSVSELLRGIFRVQRVSPERAIPTA